MKKTNLLYEITTKTIEHKNILLLSLDSPSVKLTGMTIPTMLSFYKTISDPIISSIKRSDKSNKKHKQIKKPIIIKKQPLNSKLLVLLSNLSFDLYKYDIKESSSIRFVAPGILFNLEITQMQNGQMNRHLKFKFLPITLYKKIVDKSNVSQLKSILKLPLIRGDLDTLQKSPDDSVIKYNFITTFDGLIDPSLNLSDYEQILATIKFTVSQIKMDISSPKFKTEEQNKAKIAYVFEPVQYQFNPGFKVGIGTSIQPDISWLLNLFGISDAHIIPSKLFEYVCLGLESFLLALYNTIGETK